MRTNFPPHTAFARTETRGIISATLRDANGQALVYIYSRDSEAEALRAKVLTKDEARRIAINVAQLPELLGKGERET
jgi:hypothetical protein